MGEGCDWFVRSEDEDWRSTSRQQESGEWRWRLINLILLDDGEVIFDQAESVRDSEIEIWEWDMWSVNCEGWEGATGHGRVLLNARVKN